jgi:hypothetical protein
MCLSTFLRRLFEFVILASFSVFFFFLFFFLIRYFLHLHFKCYPQSPPYPSPASFSRNIFSYHFFNAFLLLVFQFLNFYWLYMTLPGLNLICFKTLSYCCSFFSIMRGLLMNFFFFLLLSDPFKETVQFHWLLKLFVHFMHCLGCLHFPSHWLSFSFHIRGLLTWPFTLNISDSQPQLKEA